MAKCNQLTLLPFKGLTSLSAVFVKNGLQRLIDKLERQII